MTDISVTAGNVLMAENAVPKRGTAGGTITAGMSLYRDATTGELLPADADVAASSQCVGIALNGASDGQPLQYQEDGDITIGGTVVVGEVYVVSTTAGGIAPLSDLATGDYVSVIGVGITTGKIRMGIINSGVVVPA